MIANAVLLGGHIQVGDRTFLGGGAGHPSVLSHRRGRHDRRRCKDFRGRRAFLSGDGARNALIGLNVVGLRRRGIKGEVFRELKRAFHALDQPVGKLREMAGGALECGVNSRAPRRGGFLEFFAGGRRGFVRSRRAVGAEESTD